MFHGKLIYRRSCAGKIVRVPVPKEIRCTYLAYPFSSRHPSPPGPVPFLEIKCKFLYYSWQFRLMSPRSSNYFANFVRGETWLNIPLSRIFAWKFCSTLSNAAWNRNIRGARETVIDTFFLAIFFCS